MRFRFGFTLLLGAVLALSGCQTIGVGSVTRDRLGYATVIGESWKEQMLLNIVKLRYLDTPVFVDVSSIISSYTLQSQVDIAAQAYPYSLASASAQSNHRIGLSGTYTDRPTISYVPLTGERLVNSLLRPIPPATVFALIGGGGRADFILRSAVKAINGIHNTSTSPSRPRRDDSRFVQVAEALGRIEEAGALGVRIERAGERTRPLVLFRRGVDDAVDQDIALVKEMLGLDPKVDTFRLTFGVARENPDEIVLLTHSMQSMMGEMSAGVDIPEQDLLDRRATSRRADSASSSNAPLMNVRSGNERPADAFAAVQYRDHWFWIDDRDLVSKRMFRFLLTFSSMAESGTLPQGPLLTIPAG